MSSQKETQPQDTRHPPNPDLHAEGPSSIAESMNGYPLFFLTIVAFNHSQSAPVLETCSFLGFAHKGLLPKFRSTFE
jgi:hypothetical protein